MKRPIVIAGNGPSLAHIDYRRLPADFDVFRCNQFYFEDKYFLGRKITGAFLRPLNIKHQFFNFKILQQRDEYEIENIYSISNPEWEYEKGQRIGDDFPEVINCHAYMQKMKEFNQLHQFFALYYNQTFTSVIWMLICALGMGYREIYLIGLDFYEGWGGGELCL